MGIVKRQSIPATIILYLGVALGYLNAVIFMPMALKPEQFGLVRFLLSTAALLVPFAQMGMTNIIIRFHPYFQEQEAGRKFLFTVLFVPLVSFAVLFGLLWLFRGELLELFREKSPLILQYYHWLVPLTFFMMYNAVLAAYDRTLLRIVVPNLLREFFLRLFIMLALLLFYFSLIGFDRLLLLYAGAYGLITALLLAYTHASRPLRFAWPRGLAKPSMRRDMTWFGLFSMLSSTGNFIVGTIDTVMLSALAGLAKTGIYSVAFFLGLAIELPRRSISQITTPLIARAWAKQDLATIRTIYQKASLNQTVAGLLFFLGIWCNIDAIFSLIPNGSVYMAGKYVVLFIALGKLVNMMAGNNSEIIVNSRHYRFNFYAVLMLAGVTVLTNYLFIPRWGITGAAMASALSISLFNLVKFLFILTRWRIQPFSPGTLKALLVALAAFAAATVLPRFHPVVLDIFIRSVVILLLYVPGIYFWNVSEDVNQVVDGAFRKMLRFLNK